MPILKQLEKELGVVKPFSASEWVSKTIIERGMAQEFITTFERKKSFKQICKIIHDELNDIIVDDTTAVSNEQSPIEHITNTWLERQHQAVVGDEHAMSYFISKIMEVLTKHNITTKEFPSFYDSLAEAIFHEVWGVSILRKWDKMPESEAAVIRGKELWIDLNGHFEKQEEEFENEEAVQRVKRAFIMRTKDAIINEQNPELEIEREDGSRITMIQKPRGKENYIIFRRFIVKNLSLEEQARLETIREEDIPLFRSFSRSMANIIIAGRVRSAKTTFMKSMIRERNPAYVIAVMEKHYELNLSSEFKNRLIFETQAKEGDLHHVVPRLLRMEHDYIVVGEIRSIETEGYLQSTERGERGALSTYHLTNVKTVIPQITRHILDEFPNRKFENELARVAKNIDLIICMSTDNGDRRKKRVISVTEIRWDEENKKHSEVDLIRYSPITDQYYYSSDISKELLYLMAEESLENTKIIISHLKKQEQKYPMSDYEKIKDDILDILIGEKENE